VVQRFGKTIGVDKRATGLGKETDTASRLPAFKAWDQGLCIFIPSLASQMAGAGGALQLDDTSTLCDLNKTSKVVLW